MAKHQRQNNGEKNDEYKSSHVYEHDHYSIVHKKGKERGEVHLNIRHKDAFNHTYFNNVPAHIGRAIEMDPADNYVSIDDALKKVKQQNIQEIPYTINFRYDGIQRKIDVSVIGPNGEIYRLPTIDYKTKKTSGTKEKPAAQENIDAVLERLSSQRNEPKKRH